MRWLEIGVFNNRFVFFLFVPVLQSGEVFQIHLTFFKVEGDNSKPNFCLFYIKT